MLCNSKEMSLAGSPHSIDPSVMVDEEGRWWLSYGSWNTQEGDAGGGVWQVELNATTGLLVDGARAFCDPPGSPFCWSDEAHSPFYNVGAF